MREEYPKIYSGILGRDMESAVFGEKGKVCFFFPSQNGRFYDFKNFGMLPCLEKYIDAGKLKLVCVDGIDCETWSDEAGNSRYRIELQERWFKYVVDELFPYHVKPGEKAIVYGCSMGGVHAGNFFFRRPDLFDTMISLSGLFNAQFFFHDYIDDLVYDNSPVHFLKNMPDNHPWTELYKKSKIIACVGQGAWEEDCLYGTRELDKVLAEKNIPHIFDYWGFDVAHDWYWWKKQTEYIFDKFIEL